MTNRLVEDIAGGALLAALASVAAVSVVRIIAHVGRQRRHRPRANKRFLAPYRAMHPQTSRVTVEASTSSRALPVSRPPAPVDAGLPPTPASAGSTSRPGADDDQ